jgi:L-threonylcarbamoyladenylate synthase
MKTEVIKASSPHINEELQRLGKIIRNGGLVAFPTETVYGLGGNGLDPEAAKKIYAAKGRPSDNPLILHVSGIEDVERLVTDITPLERTLMEAFWPGPLTLVLPKKDIVPDETSGGLPTVALRCPSLDITRQWIKACGVPIAGPSANRSGRPSPTTAEAVLHDMDGRIEAIIDAGETAIGLESTIVSARNGKITIYRPGGITPEMLAAYGPVEVDPGLSKPSDHPLAPGMKYRHYAPQAPLTVYTGKEDEVVRSILSYVEKKDKVYGYFVSDETAEQLPEGSVVFRWGHRHNQKEMAHNLFQGLLYFNEHPVDEIIGEGTSEEGIGFAIMNRLTKASGYHIIIKGAQKKDK